ncbi:nicotinamide riboside transporter PnuC [Aerococcus urinae]|uniref:Nicotinamide riboside transporter PnuC n=2 Tax=Aerococcus mictus TaxID=2976810 RepID=A0A1E9PGA8_9LACT|nr:MULTISPECIES: nicotinamide riboside transporter PnuC [Aerococcus]KAA9291216.1 nicotinamide mononucleotide transporter [Aerococcus mictus]MBU5611220.1 nicotinamide riboside transporter PnuC [Aerococcus urinae]MCY3064955.1 nicotinamide riboside transporter PnuC [Aerococcus mictus]MCY3077322.1 nicotinamide riboside transporter PnuC [Aerococcus mictus]MCY3081421.1 nicotinamide riboside transporter PnuC [Aerococcus mictus]
MKMKNQKTINIIVDLALVVITVWGSFQNGWFNLPNLVSYLGLIGVIGLAKKWQGNFIFNGIQNLSAAIVAGRSKIYGDMFTSLYYLITQFFGYREWENHKDRDGLVKIDEHTNWRMVLFAIFIGFFLLGGLSWWLGGVYIFWDAFNNATAIIAQYMQVVQRKRSSWILWLVTNVVSMSLFLSVGVPQMAIMYFVFSLNAVRGWLNWGM